MEPDSRLAAFFAGHPRLAVALSGGVDSAYLLWAACRAGCQVRAYMVRSAFQPAFEAEDAQAAANLAGAALTVLDADILSDPAVVRNGPDRCYHCKRNLFSRIAEAARRDGFPLVADGANASDDSADRPGMRALEELGIRSPLRECGLVKAEIRLAARRAGLPVHDKPAYACLATRIPPGTAIIAGDLRRVEAAEDALLALGFRDFRVRLAGPRTAKIQVTEGQMGLLAARRSAVLTALSPHFDEILADLSARKESS